MTKIFSNVILCACVFGGLCPGGIASWGIVPGDYIRGSCPGGIVQGVWSKGVLSRGNCPASLNLRQSDAERSDKDTESSDIEAQSYDTDADIDAKSFDRR